MWGLALLLGEAGHGLHPPLHKSDDAPRAYKEGSRSPLLCTPLMKSVFQRSDCSCW